jgi:Plavaka transposase
MWSASLTRLQTKSHSLSFKSAAALHDRIEQLPYPGPRWLSRVIDLPYGTTAEPIVLLYRDPLACIRFLLSRPNLASHMTFVPKKVYRGPEETRIISEMYTANWWWDVQVRPCRVPLRT